ncbi:MULTISPECIES: hypothetical protein [Streptomyces]|uniref:Uncharacterized protein n=1 Tax=Streptomyces lichenis TaxID=2306967 RepID=A0ABT0I6U4_9ACTN|nr:hypothetical protein [Streptomyces lichenis]MCK8677038.1 hypothetical protein [Streptomyces lichenis]
MSLLTPGGMNPAFRMRNSEAANGHSVLECCIPLLIMATGTPIAVPARSSDTQGNVRLLPDRLRQQVIPFSPAVFEWGGRIVGLVGDPALCWNLRTVAYEKPARWGAARRRATVREGGLRRSLTTTSNRSALALHDADTVLAVHAAGRLVQRLRR